jgi:peptidoglycan hydrolase-like protein with peptidoglycan-binding domain
MSPDVVKKAQQALKDKGHDAGPIDGKYGPLTAQGVKKFQEAEKIKVTGQLDAQTLSALGIEQGSSAAGAGSEKASPSSPASSAGGSSEKPGNGSPAGAAGSSSEKPGNSSPASSGAASKQKTQ